MPNLCQTYAKPMPNLWQNHAKTMPKLCQNYAKPMQKLCQTYAKTTPTLCQTYAKTMPNLCQLMPNLCQTYAKPMPKPWHKHVTMRVQLCGRLNFNTLCQDSGSLTTLWLSSTASFASLGWNFISFVATKKGSLLQNLSFSYAFVFYYFGMCFVWTLGDFVKGLSNLAA